MNNRLINMDIDNMFVQDAFNKAAYELHIKYDNIS